MEGNLEEFVTLAIHHLKLRTRYWHEDNPYTARINADSTILEVKNHLVQGQAWEDGFRHAQLVPTGRPQQRFEN